MTRSQVRAARRAAQRVEMLGREKTPSTQQLGRFVQAAKYLAQFTLEATMYIERQDRRARRMLQGEFRLASVVEGLKTLLLEEDGSERR